MDGCCDRSSVTRSHTAAPSENVNFEGLEDAEFVFWVFMSEHIGPNLLKFLSNKIKMSPVQRQLNPLSDY